MTVGEDPHAFEIDGLFTDSQLKKAEEAHKNTYAALKNAAAAITAAKEEVQLVKRNTLYMAGNIPGIRLQ